MRIIARLNIGGPAIHVTLLTAELQDSVFSSTLVTGQISSQEGDMSYLANELGVKPVIIPGMGRDISFFDDFITLLQLIRWTHRLRPHIVHTHTAKAGFVGRLAAYLSGVPVIIHTYHGHVFRGYFGSLKTSLFILLERMTARFSDMLLTISDTLREDLISFEIAPPERIKVIPLGLNLLPFVMSHRQGTFRRSINCDERTPLVVIVGRLVPIKNHDLFLLAAQKISAMLPEARFVIVGDGERRGELESMVAQLGITEVVHFVGWQRELAAIYADADVLVLTSHNEGTPVSVIEAMAAGVPVVATAVGGVPDLLKDDNYGFLVPPNDVDTLTETVLKVLRFPRWGNTHLETRELICKQYGISRLQEDLRNLYMEILRQKGFSLPEEGEGDQP
jgi:glycosyltransferase involved in cell wall biosynthesis